MVLCVVASMAQRGAVAAAYLAVALAWLDRYDAALLPGATAALLRLRTRRAIDSDPTGSAAARAAAVRHSYERELTQLTVLLTSFAIELYTGAWVSTTTASSARGLLVATLASVFVTHIHLATWASSHTQHSLAVAAALYAAAGCGARFSATAAIGAVTWPLAVWLYDAAAGAPCAALAHAPDGAGGGGT